MLDPDPLPPGLTSGRAGDAELFADITAEAFADDPFNQWVFGDHAAMRATFRAEAAGTYLPKGHCHNIGQDAAAMWLPPGPSRGLPLRKLPAVMAAILKGGGLEALRRARTADTAMARAVPDRPHLYLFTIGVRPGAQGRGLGHRLLAPMLRAADAAGLPTYLESSNPDNHDFYAGHGFRTRQMLTVRPDAPPLETMWREASSGLSAG